MLHPHFATPALCLKIESTLDEDHLTTVSTKYRFLGTQKRERSIDREVRGRLVRSCYAMRLKKDLVRAIMHTPLPPFPSTPQETVRSPSTSKSEHSVG